MDTSERCVFHNYFIEWVKWFNGLVYNVDVCIYTHIYVQKIFKSNGDKEKDAGYEMRCGFFYSYSSITFA